MKFNGDDFNSAENLHEKLCDQLRTEVISWIDSDYIPLIFEGDEHSDIREDSKLKELAKITRYAGNIVAWLGNEISKESA